MYAYMHAPTGLRRGEAMPADVISRADARIRLLHMVRRSMGSSDY
jgi:hypothetical protein